MPVTGWGPADGTGAPVTTAVPKGLTPVSALHLRPPLHAYGAGITTSSSG